MKGVGKLKINLSAIQKNWQRFNQLTIKKNQVAAVVKADGYGLGVGPVVKALHEAGCEIFFVASLSEAIEVKEVVEACLMAKRAGKDPEIYILSAIKPDDFQLCSEKNFIPVLYSVAQIKHWAHYCSEKSITPRSAIKVDTGMHRLGISEAELVELISDAEVLKACNPVVLMSHLACADDKDHPLNAEQLNKFTICSELFKSVFPEIKLSLANSSGVFLGEQYHFDIVRAGIGLYGGNPSPYQENVMLPVVDLDLPIAQIKEVEGPAAVGYGATFAISPNQKMKLAVVLGGYADGVLRSLSNTGVGYIAGEIVPIVGRVSMDSMIFDVSAVDDNLLENASISLIGSEQSVDQLGKLAGTISYEILTSLGDRYDRDYIGL
ncbi:MAG: alanine racemase [Cellvibrionaceae bacterium]